VQIFVVVSKSRPDLYQYFTTGFAGLQQIKIIVDRRIGPEHPHGAAGATDPGNRRAARNVYEELEQRGFVIVRLPS